MSTYIKELVIQRCYRAATVSKQLLFSVFLFFVRRIPYRVRYWVIVMAWADATQGKWSNEEVPAIRVHHLLERMK